MRSARRRSILGLLGVSAAAAVAVPIYAFAAPDPSDLPDLVSEPPANEYLEAPWDRQTPVDDRLLLRFDGYVTNSPSAGSALEIRASNPDPAGRMQSVQQVGDSDFPGDPSAIPVGPAAGGPPTVQFETADDHLHFHLKDAAEYTLWNEGKTAQVALAQKTEAGFCLEDTIQMPGAGPRRYSVSQSGFCWQTRPSGQTTLTMGITPGWKDEYHDRLTYQWVDVSSVQPGRYVLAGRVDPRDVILESDEFNNGYAFMDSTTTIPGHLAQPVSQAQTGAPTQVTLQAATFGSPSGPRQFRILSAPAHGTLSQPVGATFSGSTVTYTPKPGYRGSDSFTYAAVTGGNPYPRTPAAAAASLIGDSVSVAISGAPAKLLVGTSAQLSAAVVNAPGGVTWSASAGTISPSGLYVAPGSPPPGGAVTIQARSTENPEAVGEARIAIVPAPKSRPAGAGTGGDRVTLSARQLLINQRISQAAVRRANAVQGWLDAGVRARDLGGGAIGAKQLGRGIAAGPAATPAALTPADPRPLRVARPKKGGEGDRVTLSERQLLINQRVSQAAIRRLNGLAKRLDGRLTGGDLVPGAVAAGKLAAELRILAADMSVPRPPASRTPIATPSRGRGASVSLTARQLRINQRIAQAAVRRANALANHLESGLDGNAFAADTVVARNIAPELRP